MSPNAAIPWTAAGQAFLSVTISQSLLKFMSIKSVMPCNHLILCCPLFLCLMFPSLRVFSNESALHSRMPKGWSFSISPSFIVMQVFFPLAYLFICWMHWVFFAFAQVFSLAAASRGYSLLPSMVPGHWGSVVVVQGLSCPQACGIFPDQ